MNQTGGDKIKTALDLASKSINHLWSLLRRKLQSGQFDHTTDIEEFLNFTSEHGLLHKVKELHKSNDKAAKLRNAANRLYLEKKFEEALTCYNESICFAEPGSDQLGMGYANRSAVYFEQGEYEFALYNIDLAKKNNYPEKLMPKLQARELNCQHQIALGHSKETVPQVRLNINVVTNPKIPFLAKGIRMDYDPKFERGVYAEKDFNPGDVILEEKLELCGVDFNLSYTTCNQCTSEFNLSLIPCPTCPFFMYCSKKCLELNWKLYHRFECEVVTKLCSATFISGMITPRFFFYGLSQFDDDVEKMMNFCELQVSTGSNPLELDYTHLNRLELFRALHNIKPCTDTDFELIAKVTAVSYYVVLLTNPLIGLIIRTEPQRQFFLRSLQTYMHSVGSSVVSNTTIRAKGHSTCLISPVGSICNHSCDPNVVRFIDSGKEKMVILRPIRAGEQIFASYSPAWWKERPTHPLDFECRCVVCDQGAEGREWRSRKNRDFPMKALKNVIVMKGVLDREDANLATKMNAVQQLIKRYDHFHPQRHLGTLLDVYNNFIMDAIEAENLALARAKLRTEYAEI